MAARLCLWSLLAVVLPALTAQTALPSPALRQLALDLYRPVVQQAGPPGAEGQHRKPPWVDRPLRHPPGRRTARGFLDPEPTVGAWRVLVLLVDFSDCVSSRYPGTAAQPHFADLLFGEAAASPGSMRDYYLANSRGQFTLSGDVKGGATGWYCVPQPSSYYLSGGRRRGRHLPQQHAEAGRRPGRPG